VKFVHLDYGVNSILFQRGIYPAEQFVPEQKYGLTILMSKDEKIKDFLKNVFTQAEGKLMKFLKFTFNNLMINY
jgi:mitotic spindle assembly checkpoint protein MAD2